MKKIFIALGLIGLIHLTAGSKASVGTAKNRKASEMTSDLFAPIFTELDGNLFVAIKAKEGISIEDGAVVRFEFAKKETISSFHINDVNQNLIDTGEADLFVMIHQELAIKLKSQRVEKIHIDHNGVIHTINVNRFWIPDEFLRG